MNTLADNITQAISDFDACRNAIIGKGVDVPMGTPTSAYGAKIASIPDGGQPVPAPVEGWQPHWYWSNGSLIDIHDEDGTIPENSVRLLVNTRTELRTYAFTATAAGGYTVTWGTDGTEDYASAATAQHTFADDYPEDYAVITITAASPITVFRVAKHDVSTRQQEHGVLWAVVRLPSITAAGGNYMFCAALAAASTAYCRKLECCEFVDVKSIGNYAFSDCSSLQSIVIPESVTSIGAYAFQNCYSLQSCLYNGTLPSAVAGMALFTNCEMLTKLDWPGAKFTTFSINGASGLLNKLGSEGNIDGYDLPIRLDWANCTWTGTAPQLNVSYTMLDADQLNALFAHLVASGNFSGKTINITGCTGAATCDRTILTNAGGIVTG